MLHSLSARDASIYKWKPKDGMEVSEAKGPKTFEDENTRLNRLLADAMLDSAALKDLSERNGDFRGPEEAVAHLQESFGMSERRAMQNHPVAA